MRRLQDVGGPDVTRDELFDALSALADGTLTPERHAALERALEADPAARKTYFEYLDLHLALGKPDKAASPLRRGRRGWIAAAVGLAAAGLLAFLALGRGEAPARLSRSAGARFYGPAPERLRPGQEYALVAGTVELAFASGALVLLDAPAAFEIRDPLRMLLKYGRGSIQVDERSKGFTVDTPVAKVVDRGTRFALDVGEGGETEVHVLEGAADIGETRLTKGDARRVDPRGMSNVPLDAERFPKEIPDRVVSYEATPASDLVAVTVRRDGREIRYPVERLIGIDAIHYKVSASGNWAATAAGVDVPPPGRRHELLDRDRNLNTGLINFGSAATPLNTDPVMNDPEDPARPNTPGLGFRFRTPVVNGPGPDVVFFEYQPVIQPENGDPFHVSPLRFAPGLRSKTVTRWDLSIYSPEALTLSGFRLNTFTAGPTSLSAYESAEVKKGADFTVASKGLALAFDLSDLGFAPGAAVDGLFLQDAPDAHGPRHQVDPTFIAGLPHD
jgi:ferric-dicitrate binding protein FerR (iron transport regulator)